MRRGTFETLAKMQDACDSIARTRNDFRIHRKFSRSGRLSVVRGKVRLRAGKSIHGSTANAVSREHPCYSRVEFGRNFKIFARRRFIGNK